VIVLVGSAYQGRSTRNPFDFTERQVMIRGCLDAEQNQRVHIAPLADVTYNDESWVRNVQTTVLGLTTALHKTPHRPVRIGLIGHSKDQSAYYLKLFPQWGSVEVKNVGGIHATAIREEIFSCTGPDAVRMVLEADGIRHALPQNVKAMLKQFSESDRFQLLRDEQNFVAQYRKAWDGAPYAPTFVTVDAVVVQSGHILLVRRKARPGKGMLALPGGFIRGNEKIIDACVRELREETRLKIPAPVLKGSIQKQQVFDDPHRSTRGRTITHAFYIELEPNQDLPKVKGGDDAEQAMWIPLAELDPSNLFEDHFFIIREMTGM